MCGLKIEVEGKRILSIRGDEDDSLSRGYICPKGNALQDLHEDPDRLRQPVRRVGDRWEPIGWNEALDEVADQLHAIQQRHGNDAVGMYIGNPNVHNMSTLLFGPMLLRGLRTRNRFSATSVDQLPHMLASYLMLGHQLLFTVPDIDRTQYMLIIGGNPLASNGSLMSAPGVKKRLKAIQERGGKVVVIDPRRSETAKVADAHHFIRPGTDAFFVLGMLNVILERGARLRHLSDKVDNLDVLKNIAAQFPLQTCADASGIDAHTIEAIAHDYLAAESAVCYGRMGAHTQEFGGICAWIIHCINILGGNFDRQGGVMFTKPALDPKIEVAGMGLDAGSFGRYHSRRDNLPEFGGELPVTTMADEILTPGDTQIRAMIVSAGNPVLSVPNGTQLDRAFESLEFMVSLDMYVTETSRHANLILPPVSQLERSHYDIALNMVAVRNVAKYSEPLFDPPRDGKTDGVIMLEILARLQRKRRGLFSKNYIRTKALLAAGADRVLDLGLRTGPYGKSHGLSVKKLRKHPHGIDLGPLQPADPQLLPYKRAAIDLAPKPFVDDVARLRASRVHQGLVLIGRRQLRSNNSWMHNCGRLMRGKDRCTLMINPVDAKRLNINDGDLVQITSNVGSVSAPAEVTDDLLAGVVSLPHGFGHNRKGVALRVAQQKPGVSINDVLDNAHIDRLSGNAALSGLPVEVARVSAEVPDATRAPAAALAE